MSWLVHTKWVNAKYAKCKIVTLSRKMFKVLHYCRMNNMFREMHLKKRSGNLFSMRDLHSMPIFNKLWTSYIQPWVTTYETGQQQNVKTIYNTCSGCKLEYLNYDGLPHRFITISPTNIFDIYAVEMFGDLMHVLTKSTYSRLLITRYCWWFHIKLFIQTPK